MCDIQIHVQCHGQYSEVIVDDRESAELFVEELVGKALQEVFETVIIDGVIIREPLEETNDAGRSDRT